MSEHVLSRILLNLARTKVYPNGSTQHGYEFVAPLRADGHIDEVLWRAHAERCRVRRFWLDEEDEIGHVVLRGDGSWAFTYDIDGSDDDEAGFNFGAHAFRPGEYVSIRDEDGDLHPFQVMLVEPV